MSANAETLNATTLDQLRQLAAENRDAAGAFLPDDEAPYYVVMLGFVEGSSDGHWIWPRKLQSGSPIMRWPGYAMGAMVRRKIWRIAAGVEPGNGLLSLSRRCAEKRCVRPDRNHVVLSPWRKGGGDPKGGNCAPSPLTFTRRFDANDIARLTESLFLAAAKLRERGVNVSLRIGPHPSESQTESTASG